MSMVQFLGFQGFLISIEYCVNCLLTLPTIAISDSCRCQKFLSDLLVISISSPISRWVSSEHFIEAWPRGRRPSSLPSPFLLSSSNEVRYNCKEYKLDQGWLCTVGRVSIFSLIWYCCQREWKFGLTLLFVALN